MTTEGPPRADELQDLAHTPVLLVACDYDGTISPIVNDPAAAIPIPEAISALRALASLPDTHVAVISGRSLRDLALLSRLPSEIHLVGSHGSEFDPSFIDAMPAAASAVRERLYAAARKIVDRHPDLRIEYKTTGVTFHTRAMDRRSAEKALAAVRHGPGRLDGVFAHEGKEILELLVMPTDKGRALERLRHGTGATAAIYIGDDTTDEGAFSTLAGPDIGLKVGHGATKASHRLREPSDVARSLAQLAEERRRWVLGDRATPIEKHTLLSNHRTAALVKIGRAHV